jgi:protein HOOK3
VDESSLLKDELDEYRHVMDKLHKAENTLEKHKKKMEDSGDLKRQIKVGKATMKKPK